ncbi:Ldh family oxidoreductase [Candidatus Bathyarchaeota archaeon]|nr:MAG: Ldh family oxidoreductase [Candidatus Bathyarchaeota archaeon]
MIRVPADKITELGIEIFTKQGTSLERATFLVETLVEGNLAGHDSHGVYYYTRYSERIKQGYIKPMAEPEIIKETPGTAFIDGKWTFGQITAKKLVETAVDKAKENMVSAVGAFNCNHIGRIGYYTSWAAKQGIISTFYVNVGNPIVSLHNGLGKTFGTNPYSASVPTGGDIPFLVDYATSVVAAGKLSVASAKKAKIPKHWTRDQYGRVNDDPNILRDGGWLLPFGEYKGYGLQMVCELLGAVLTGSRVGPSGVELPPSPNGIFMMAVNPEAFIGLDEFTKNTDALLKQVKNWPALGVERVYVPGEPEKETKEKRLREGIDLPETTWGEIMALCEELGIDADAILK